MRYDVRNAALRGVFMHIEVAKRIVRTSPVSEPPHVSAMHLAVGEDTLADGFDLGQIDGCTAEDQLEVNKVVRPFAFWLTGTMQLLRNLMLEGHYRNFARSRESQGGECVVDILGSCHL